MPPILQGIDASISVCDECKDSFLSNTSSPIECPTCQKPTQWQHHTPLKPTQALKHTPIWVALNPLLHRHRYDSLPSDLTLFFGFFLSVKTTYADWQSEATPLSWSPVIAVLAPQFLHLHSEDFPHDIMYDLDLPTRILVSHSSRSLHKFALLPLHPTTTEPVVLMETTTAQARCHWERAIYERCGVPALDSHLESLVFPAALPNAIQFPSRGRYHAELLTLLDKPEEHLETEVPFGKLLSTLHEVYPELLEGRFYPIPVSTPEP